MEILCSLFAAYQMNSYRESINEDSSPSRIKFMMRELQYGADYHYIITLVVASSMPPKNPWQTLAELWSLLAIHFVIFLTLAIAHDGLVGCIFHSFPTGIHSKLLSYTKPSEHYLNTSPPQPWQWAVSSSLHHFWDHNSQAKYLESIPNFQLTAADQS